LFLLGIDFILTKGRIKIKRLILLWERVKKKSRFCCKLKKMEDFFSKNLLWLIALLLGLIFLGAGILGFRAFQVQSGPKVEILGEQETQPTTVKVEIAGEVVKPGVYELAGGSRTNDLLIAASGFGAKADREWVAKNINLAAKLVDGAKIYIPPKDQIQNPKSEIRNNDQNSNVQMSKINLNTASVVELDSLWGVGEVTAKKIIEGRPYQRPEELLEKKIVKSNVWEKIKDQVTVY